MAQVSIIIPVHNKEKYLDNTITSVLNQLFTDFEVIAVDDGSTDSSKEILRRFADKDNRITLILTENRGVSCARNTGLNAASGEWIQFLDGDDLIDPEYLIKALELISDNVDVLFSDFCMIDETGKAVRRIESCKTGPADPVQVCSDFMELQLKNGFFGYISNKLFSRRLLEETGASFDPGLTLAEDLDFYVHLYRGIKKAYYLNSCSFYYLQTPDNYQNKSNIDYFGQLKVQLAVREWFEMMDCLDPNKDSLDKRVADYVYTVLFEEYERSNSVKGVYDSLLLMDKALTCVKNSLQNDRLQGRFKKKVLESLIDKDLSRTERLFRLRTFVRSIYRLLK